MAEIIIPFILVLSFSLNTNISNVKKARLNSMLTALDNSKLADVPKNTTLSNVDTLLSLQLGTIMCISFLYLDATSFKIARFFFICTLNRLST